MTPRGTIAGIAAVRLACWSVAAPALHVPQGADSRIPQLVAIHPSVERRAGVADDPPVHLGAELLG